MKLFVPLTVILGLSVLLPLFSLAQKNKDYNILLNSGTFTPAEKNNNLIKSSAVFSSSRFNNNHYLVLQFVALPTDLEKSNLSAAGIKLADYLPNNAYTAIIKESFEISILQSKNIRSIFQLSPEQKTLPQLLLGNFPAHAVKTRGTVDLTVTTYQKLNVAELATIFNNSGIVVLEDMPMFRSFTLRIPQQNFRALLSLAFVQWVEPIDPPNVLENLLGRSLHRANVLNDGVRNLKGQGVNIGIWDEAEVDAHIDFMPLANRLSIIEPGISSDHSTHCGGTLGSAGLLNPRARGMAPKAKIFSWNFNGNIALEQANGIAAHNLSVSSHSYGTVATCGLTGSSVAYSSASRNTDINMNNFPNHLHIHSSGNSQTSCAGGWSTITGSGKSAKNNILVGNITSTEVLSGSSSNGPVSDGRVKPEITAFGTGVFSTFPNNTYATISGTSMATPGVAGAVALLIERYRQLNSGQEPASALIKNTILNTAQDLGNVGPDYRFGYGRLNVLSAVRILEQNRYVIGSIADAATNETTVVVPASAARLKVMITWNDPAGTANAALALVNNLNLSVINGATTTLPWVLDPLNPSLPATRAADNVSNIEQVVIDNPGAGSYTFRVEGAAVPQGPQQYSLTWVIEQPYIEVIYPNGNESFNPGTAETITWDNAGVTGPQTVEYSLNNGVSWTLLSATVPPNTTRLSWTPPAGGNTAAALVRVTSGAIADVSDTNFKILSTPTGLSTTSTSCAAGELNFSWVAVNEATHYDVLKLNLATGVWTVLGNNVTGTIYTVSGLTPDLVEWFSILARNNITGAVSERSVAISRLIPNTGLSAIGSISGSGVICGAANNISYTVPAVSGATSYTWTVPAGAIINSGQGTAGIMVNYPAGSTSGTVTVVASSGPCQTPPATLSIAVSSMGTPPVTGGNQSQVYCTPNPVPTLTASATVPAGHVLVWYNAASNGTIVMNPVLSSIGTITFYAASRNTASNCESTVRTAVVLTISPAPAPTISASGPLTFCQGGSVVLTATAGNSYAWSNGATNQSVTVSTAGSYSVTVDQGNGCVTSSAGTNVTVNPLPAINITSGSSTTFCQGGSVTLTATIGNTYAWSNGASTASINVNSTGPYSVTVDQGNACINTSAGTMVTVNPLPVATITAAGPTNFCEGESVVLTASAGSAYSWSNAATTATTNVTASGNYSVTITDARGCSATSASTAIMVTPKPLVSIASSPFTKLFPGINTTITATASVPVSYTWFRNGGTVPGAGTATLPVNIDNIGAYTVRVTNTAGCSNTSAVLDITDSATAKIFIYPNPNKGQFQVSYYNPLPTQNNITVFDARGARILSKSVAITTAYQRMNVDVRNHGKGTYTVVLSNKENKKLATATVVVL